MEFMKMFKGCFIDKENSYVLIDKEGNAKRYTNKEIKKISKQGDILTLLENKDYREQNAEMISIALFGKNNKELDINGDIGNGRN